MTQLENQNLQNGETQQVVQLVDSWRKSALPTETFEYSQAAVDHFAKSAATGEPASVITPICVNYETVRVGGARRPTIHREMVFKDWGVRAGYALLHEEIPHRLSQLQDAGVSVNQLVVAVDLGMSSQLFTDVNPDVAGKTPTEALQYVSDVVDSNVSKMDELLHHGLQTRGIDQAQIKVVRLSQILADHPDLAIQFLHSWQTWNHQLRDVASVPHNRWGGLIREALEKDGRYLKEAWGYTNAAQVETRVIDENFGLTAALGDNLHALFNNAYGTDLQDKGGLVMLDPIPGPRNPGHREFFAYNLDQIDGTHRTKTPILRPFHNRVLLSNSAVEVPYLGKSLTQMQQEADEYEL